MISKHISIVYDCTVDESTTSDLIAFYYTIILVFFHCPSTNGNRASQKMNASHVLHGLVFIVLYESHATICIISEQCYIIYKI